MFAPGRQGDTCSLASRERAQSGSAAFPLPPVADHLSSYIEVLGIAAEGLLMLWLLVLGVNVQRWKEQADAAVGL